MSSCATCDAELYEGVRVVVVGSGDTAVEEAGFISRFADEVVMLVVHDEGTLDCNRTQAETAFANPKITWMWNRSILAIEGEEAVTGVQGEEPAHRSGGGRVLQRGLHFRGHRAADGFPR